jgi:hypothetical protein
MKSMSFRAKLLSGDKMTDIVPEVHFGASTPMGRGGAA